MKTVDPRGSGGSNPSLSASARRLRSLLLLATCAGLALAGCRTPSSPQAQELYAASLDLLVERTARTQRVGQVVSINGAGVCRDLTPVAGMAVLRVEGLDGGLRDAAERRFGSRDGVFVTAVFEGLPAAAAGVRVGDRITGVAGGKPLVASWKLLRVGVRAMPPLVVPEVDGPGIR